MNKVIYDWVTFTSKIDSPQSIIDFLGFDLSSFEVMEDKGRNHYKHRMQFTKYCNVYYGGNNPGVCVEMSGQGCRLFETYGNGDYNALFDFIVENYDDDGEKRQANITRLDVAYDDLSGVLDLYGYFVPEMQKSNYVCRSKRAGLILDTVKGCTVYHGSERQSNVYIRIYDKLKEQVEVQKNKVDDNLKHWVRCEMQLKHESALGFIKLKGDIRKNYFDVLNNYLRYIVPSNNTTNKSMIATSPEWLQFIETWETASVFAKPGMSYNLSKLDYFVTNQLSGAISTFVDLVGVDKFVQYIDEGRKQHRTLNPKYKELYKQHEKAADSIEAYLRERGL